MARAKRTDRADARRRYRVQTSTEAAAEEDGAVGAGADETNEADNAPRRTGRPEPEKARSQAQPQARVGFVAAARSAYQVADIRGDLRALPDLLRSRAVILPALLVVVTAVVLIASINAGGVTAGGTGVGPSSAPSGSPAATQASASPSSAASSAASPSPSGAGTADAGGTSGILSIVASLMSLLFIQVPPIGGIYVAAVLAKRAAYIAGGIAGLLGGVGLTAVVYSIPVEPAFTNARFDYSLQATMLSTVFGIVLGAGLGFYRRLLKNMNPGGQRPQSRGRPPAKGTPRAAAKPSRR